jgi:hypothetical protein
MHMSERQQRSDEPTANAVARGLNILTVRDADVAQSVSEAITPSAPQDE